MHIPAQTGKAHLRLSAAFARACIRTRCNTACCTAASSHSCNTSCCVGAECSATHRMRRRRWRVPVVIFAIVIIFISRTRRRRLRRLERLRRAPRSAGAADGDWRRTSVHACASASAEMRALYTAARTESYFSLWGRPAARTRCCSANARLLQRNARLLQRGALAHRRGHRLPPPALSAPGAESRSAAVRPRCGLRPRRWGVAVTAGPDASSPVCDGCQSCCQVSVVLPGVRGCAAKVHLAARGK